MKIMLETTEWEGDFPNHVYVFNDKMSHIVAYVPAGSKKLFKFQQPIPIDRRGRKFVELEDDQPEPLESKVDQWEFPGSKGDIYLVTRESGLNFSCTCPGFLYRNHCRHTAELIQQYAYDVR
jgi:hypothetical protein